MASTYGPEILLILRRPFQGAEGLIVEEVARFPPALTWQPYVVYRVAYVGSAVGAAP